MTKRFCLSTFSIVSLALFFVACRGDGDTSGPSNNQGSDNNNGGGDCQGCLDDYCDCIDGVTDTGVLTTCSTTVNTCMTAQCTAAEMQNLDLSSCTTTGYDLEICQACTDAYCACLNVGTVACDTVYTSCVESACTAQLMTQVDLSCITEIQL